MITAAIVCVHRLTGRLKNGEIRCHHGSSTGRSLAA